MRTHTALHALCGVVWRDYHAQVTGGNMEPESGRMDFEFESMSGDLVGAIEQLVNEELGAGREVRVRVLPRDEAFAIADLIRTKINLFRKDHRCARSRSSASTSGRRRDARREHAGSRPDPCDGLRVQGPDQQADPDRADRSAGRRPVNGAHGPSTP
jgi:hypothetical protein